MLQIDKILKASITYFLICYVFSRCYVIVEKYFGVLDASFLSYISNSERFFLHLDNNCQLYTISRSCLAVFPFLYKFGTLPPKSATTFLQWFSCWHHESFSCIGSLFLDRLLIDIQSRFHTICRDCATDSFL